MVKKLSPIQLIQHGITSACWQSVTDGFNALSGQSLKAPQAHAAPPVIRSSTTIAELLQYMTVEVNQQESQVPQPVRKKVAKKTPRKKPVPQPQVEEVEEDDDDGETEEDDEPQHQEFMVNKVATRKYKKRQKFVNQYVDDGSMGKSLIEDSRRMTQTQTPTERRPPVVFVDMTCIHCKKIDNIPQALVPPKLDSGSGAKRASYVCNTCR